MRRHHCRRVWRYMLSLRKESGRVFKWGKWGLSPMLRLLRQKIFFKINKIACKTDFFSQKKCKKTAKKIQFTEWEKFSTIFEIKTSPSKTEFNAQKKCPKNTKIGTANNVRLVFLTLTEFELILLAFLSAKFCPIWEGGGSICDRPTWSAGVPIVAKCPFYFCFEKK